jgi:hypothetical protein
MSRRPIDLHIEELVLHGFAPEDRYRIGEAVRDELMRLLESGGLPEVREANSEVTRAAGEEIYVRPGTLPAEVGGAVARAVYGGLRA